jgi:hypothetical protein
MHVKIQPDDISLMTKVGHVMVKKLFVGVGVICFLLMLSSCPSEPRVYPRILIETFPFDSAAASTDTILTLYDSGGTELDSNTDNPDVPPAHQPSARIDYQSGLDSGIYYIKVTGAAVGGTGPYLIRALSLVIGESVPAYDYPGLGNESDDSAFEPDDTATGNIPDSPVDIGLGNANQKNRNMNSVTDVDWLRLELP